MPQPLEAHKEPEKHASDRPQALAQSLWSVMQQEYKKDMVAGRALIPGNSTMKDVVTMANPVAVLAAGAATTYVEERYAEFKKAPKQAILDTARDIGCLLPGVYIGTLPEPNKVVQAEAAAGVAGVARGAANEAAALAGAAGGVTAARAAAAALMMEGSKLVGSHEHTSTLHSAHASEKSKRAAVEKTKETKPEEKPEHHIRH